MAEAYSRLPFIAVNLCNVVIKATTVLSLEMFLTSVSHSTEPRKTAQNDVHQKEAP